MEILIKDFGDFELFYDDGKTHIFIKDTFERRFVSIDFLISETSRIKSFLSPNNRIHFYAGLGICGNTRFSLGFLRMLFRSWIGFSGDCTYPIKTSNPQLSPGDSFHLGVDLWDKSTEYGMLRWDLLIHCICRLEEMIQAIEEQESSQFQKEE